MGKKNKQKVQWKAVEENFFAGDQDDDSCSGGGGPGDNSDGGGGVINGVRVDIQGGGGGGTASLNYQTSQRTHPTKYRSRFGSGWGGSAPLAPRFERKAAENGGGGGGVGGGIYYRGPRPSYDDVSCCEIEHLPEGFTKIRSKNLDVLFKRDYYAQKIEDSVGGGGGSGGSSEEPEDDEGDEEEASNDAVEGSSENGTENADQKEAEEDEINDKELTEDTKGDVPTSTSCGFSPDAAPFVPASGNSGGAMPGGGRPNLFLYSPASNTMIPCEEIIIPNPVMSPEGPVYQGPSNIYLAFPMAESGGSGPTTPQPQVYVPTSGPPLPPAVSAVQYDQYGVPFQQQHQFQQHLLSRDNSSSLYQSSSEGGSSTTEPASGDSTTPHSPPDLSMYSPAGWAEQSYRPGTEHQGSGMVSPPAVFPGGAAINPHQQLVQEAASTADWSNFGQAHGTSMAAMNTPAAESSGSSLAKGNKSKVSNKVSDVGKVSSNDSVNSAVVRRHIPGLHPVVADSAGNNKRVQKKKRKKKAAALSASSSSGGTDDHRGSCSSEDYFAGADNNKSVSVKILPRNKSLDGGDSSGPPSSSSGGGSGTPIILVSPPNEVVVAIQELPNDEEEESNNNINTAVHKESDVVVGPSCNDSNEAVNNVLKDESLPECDSSVGERGEGTPPQPRDETCDYEESQEETQKVPLPDSANGGDPDVEAPEKVPDEAAPAEEEEEEVERFAQEDVQDQEAVVVVAKEEEVGPAVSVQPVPDTQQQQHPRQTRTNNCKQPRGGGGGGRKANNKQTGSQRKQTPQQHRKLSQEDQSSPVPAQKLYSSVVGKKSKGTTTSERRRTPSPPPPSNSATTNEGEWETKTAKKSRKFNKQTSQKQNSKSNKLVRELAIDSEEVPPPPPASSQSTNPPVKEEEKATIHVVDDDDKANEIHPKEAAEETAKSTNEEDHQPDPRNKPSISRSISTGGGGNLNRPTSSRRRHRRRGTSQESDHPSSTRPVLIQDGMFDTSGLGNRRIKRASEVLDVRQLGEAVRRGHLDTLFITSIGLGITEGPLMTGRIGGGGRYCPPDRSSEIPEHLKTLPKDEEEDEHKAEEPEADGKVVEAADGDDDGGSGDLDLD